jgi:serine/threonine-protein kinase HipA
MEDANQVVGNWPADKYQGAGHERLGLIILSICGERAFAEYIRRLVFCIGIGNEDAHLKNWTILYEDPIVPRLSPVYDLVSTVQYDDLDRGLALKFNDSRDMRTIDRSTFDRLGRKVGVSSHVVLDIVDETIARMCEAWQSLKGDLPIGIEFRQRLAEHQRSVPLLAPFL